MQICSQVFLHEWMFFQYLHLTCYEIVLTSMLLFFFAPSLTNRLLAASFFSTLVAGLQQVFL